MVQWQLCTLEHLTYSGFGRPFPRHGLQLLFWFANQCVTCELVNSVVTMKLVSDCQPERGDYGFHLFANVEELLPVLEQPRRRRSRRRVMYFEVGNLNTEIYPASGNLPTYVRENYGNNGYYNVDRIIIAYQMRTRVAETVYVTEHDAESFGRFSPERTYEISYELIQALQSPQLDLTIFLTHTGYCGATQVVQAEDEILFQGLETSHGSNGQMMQSNDLQFFSGTFNQQVAVNIEPFNYNQELHYIVNVTSHNRRPVANYHEVQRYRKPRPRAMRQTYWPSEWELVYQDFDREAKKRSGGGGISFIKVLLSAGALYLAAKCFSWLRSCWKEDFNENIIKMIPWRTPSYQHPHIMLDYVY